MRTSQAACQSFRSAAICWQASISLCATRSRRPISRTTCQPSALSLGARHLERLEWVGMVQVAFRCWILIAHVIGGSWNQDSVVTAWHSERIADAVSESVAERDTGCASSQREQFHTRSRVARAHLRRGQRDRLRLRKCSSLRIELCSGTIWIIETWKYTNKTQSLNHLLGVSSNLRSYMKSLDGGLSWQFISAYDWTQASIIAATAGGTLFLATRVPWYPTSSFQPGESPLVSPYSISSIFL